MNKSIQYIDGLTRISAMLGALSLAAIVMAYSFEVISRYFFDAPTLWASDVVSFLLCWMIFLFMPEVTRTYGHVTISILSDRLSGVTRLQLGRFLLLLSAIACFITASVSATENVRQFVHDITTVSVYPLPKGSIAIVITFGFALSGLQFLLGALGIERAQSDRIEGFT